MRGEGKVKEKRVGKETKNQTIPLSLISHPQVFQQLDLGVEKGVCWWREGR